MQTEAEQLITEANDRLFKAKTSDNNGNVFAAQALLQYGTSKLVEAQREGFTQNNHMQKKSSNQQHL